MADNVPAVQALGQCIFLPMLIIGGVAVPLSSLPDWAQHLSAFFPGRYAVDALQASATGNGLASNAVQPSGAPRDWRGRIAWLAPGCFDGMRASGLRLVPASAGSFVAVAAWVAVGVAAESRGGVQIRRPAESVANTTVAPPQRETSTPPETAPPAATVLPAAPAPPNDARRAAVDRAAVASPISKPSVRGAVAGPEQWRAVTLQQIDADINFTRVPPDDGVVTPIAPPDEQPEPELVAELDLIRNRLPVWKPGLVGDPVQRVRNHLFVAIVPDLFQLPIERFVPHIVFDRLQETIPKDRSRQDPLLDRHASRRRRRQGARRPSLAWSRERPE